MSAPPTLSFTHRFRPATGPGAPLLLLHGTGGNEDDLLPLGHTIGPGRALLSPRGKVLENAMPRFFRRLAEGVFDEEDVIARAHQLAGFLTEARQAYDLAAPVAVGFSNGANIAAAMLLLTPEALAGAILLRAMVPLAKPPAADLAGKPVLIISGAADPIISADNARTLAGQLRTAGADVQHETVPTGHTLTHSDLAIATAWLTRKN